MMVCPVEENLLTMRHCQDCRAADVISEYHMLHAARSTASESAAAQPAAPKPAATQSSPAHPAATQPAAPKPTSPIPATPKPASPVALAAAAAKPYHRSGCRWQPATTLAPGELHHLLREDSQLDAHIRAAHRV